MKRLHLGSGGQVREGYINTDLDEMPGVDMVLDASVVPYPFEDSMLDEIYNSHMIEHIKRDKVLPMLREWKRILKPSGEVVVDVPDLEVGIQLYTKARYSWDDLLDLMFGLQEEREGQQHLWGYSSDSLIVLFKKAGFSHVSVVESPDYHLVQCGIPTFRLIAKP